MWFNKVNILILVKFEALWWEVILYCKILRNEDCVVHNSNNKYKIFGNWSAGLLTHFIGIFNPDNLKIKPELYVSSCIILQQLIVSLILHN